MANEDATKSSTRRGVFYRRRGKKHRTLSHMANVRLCTGVEQAFSVAFWDSLFMPGLPLAAKLRGLKWGRRDLLIWLRRYAINL